MMRKNKMSQVFPQAVETLPLGKQEHVYSKSTMPWLLMTWRGKKPGISSHGIDPFLPNYFTLRNRSVFLIFFFSFLIINVYARVIAYQVVWWDITRALKSLRLIYESSGAHKMCCTGTLRGYQDSNPTNGRQMARPTVHAQHSPRADSTFAPSQWETALLCNDVSHWRGASLESALPTVSSFK